MDVLWTKNRTKNYIECALEKENGDPASCDIFNLEDKGCPMCVGIG